MLAAVCTSVVRCSRVVLVVPGLLRNSFVTAPSVPKRKRGRIRRASRTRCVRVERCLVLVVCSCLVVSVVRECVLNRMFDSRVQNIMNPRYLQVSIIG